MSSFTRRRRGRALASRTSVFVLLIIYVGERRAGHSRANPQRRLRDQTCVVVRCLRVWVVVVSFYCVHLCVRLCRFRSSSVVALSVCLSLSVGVCHCCLLSLLLDLSSAACFVCVVFFG